MPVRIVTDSTCDLPAALAAQHDITVIPSFVSFGDERYLDVVDLSRSDFYKRLPESETQPTTFPQEAEVYRQTYQRLADEGATEILSIHISLSVSKMLYTVQKGAEQAPVPVTVLDSKQLSMGLGFEVLEAAQAATEGHTAAEIVAKLEDMVWRIHVVAALDTLEYLRRSGRMNWAVAGVGDLLQIKALLKMYNGNPLVEMVRTGEGAVRRLVSHLASVAPLERVSLLHAEAPERAQALRQQTAHLLPTEDVILSEISPAIGSHIGPGAVGFACVAAH